MTYLSRYGRRVVLTEWYEGVRRYLFLVGSDYV